MATTILDQTTGLAGGFSDNAVAGNALRIVIAGAAFTGSSLGQLRFTFRSGNNIGLFANHCSVALVGSATAPNTQLTPTEILTGGVSGLSVTSSSPASVVTDWLTFAFNSSTDTMLIDIDCTGATQGIQIANTGANFNSWNKASAADYNNATVSGYSNTASFDFGVMLIETQASGGATPTWFSNNYETILRRSKPDSPQRAFFLAPVSATVGPSGIPYVRQPEQVLSKKIIDSPIAFAPPLALVPVMAASSEEFPLTPPKKDFAVPSWAPQSIAASSGVGVSGIAWARQVEQSQAKQRIEPPPIAYVAPLAITVGIAGMAWSRQSEQVLARKVAQEPPPAWDPRAFVPISGMAWFRQLDNFAAKQTIQFPDLAWAELPTSVPVGISGMAWNRPFEQSLAKPTIQSASDFFWSARALVPVSGMAWHRQFEQSLRPATIQPSDLAWALFPTAVTVGISGMAWFRPFEQTVSRARTEAQTSPFIAQQNPFSPIAWGASPDQPRAAARRQQEDAAFVGPQPALPSGWHSRSAEQLGSKPLIQAADRFRFELLPSPSVGWFGAFDGVSRFAKRSSEQSSAPFIAGLPPPVGVSGIAWMKAIQNIKQPAPPDFLSQPPIFFFTTGPARGHFIQFLSAIAQPSQSLSAIAEATTQLRGVLGVPALGQDVTIRQGDSRTLVFPIRLPDGTNPTFSSPSCSFVVTKTYDKGPDLLTKTGLTPTQNSLAWSVSVGLSAADTAGIPVGRWFLQLRLQDTDGSEFTLAVGFFIVQPIRPTP